MLVAYWVACFVVTHLPPSNVPSSPFPHFDKVVHFSMFLGLALLLLPQLRGHFADVKKTIAVGILCAMIYAAVDETTQTLVGRDAEWADWLADQSGFVVGTLLWRFLWGR